MTADDVIATSGLARSSVHALCEQLISSGWLREVSADAPRSGAGRPARRYSIDHEAGHLVGIEAGLRSVRAVVSDLNGQVLAEHEAATDGTYDGEERARAVDDALRVVLSTAGADAASVLCLVVGVPAPVSADGRNAFRDNPFWDGMNPDFVDRLAAPGRTVLVDNAVNLAAVAEAEAPTGQARGVRDYVVLEVDEGFGAGVVLDGRLLRGAHGGVGEMRYLDLVEGVGSPAGVAALARGLARSALTDPAESVLQGTEPDAAAVFAAADAGDALAQEVVDEIGRRLTRVVVTVVTMFDPALVVLSGHIAHACERPRAAVEHGLPDFLEPPYPRIVMSRLGDSAVTTGALARALHHVQDNAMSLTPLGRVPR